MSKSSELDTTVKQYIIDCICAEGYDDNPETNLEKVVFANKTFRAEYGWAVERLGKQAAIREWLMGLPSSVGLAFYNHEIIELLTKWGRIPENATDKQIDMYLDRYWHFMAGKLLQLFELKRIPKDEQL